MTNPDTFKLAVGAILFVMVVRALVSLAVPEQFVISLVAEIAALYVVVDWLFGYSKRATLKIAGSYLVASIAVGLVFSAFA